MGSAIAERSGMRAQRRRTTDRRWRRLDQLLEDLRPGQTITVRGVAARTGLDTDSVDTVLEALTRAELFARIDDTTFVRDSLMKVE